MRNSLVTRVRFGLSTALLVLSGAAQCAEDPFTKWAATHALPVVTLEAGQDLVDLLPLKAVVGTTRVVALGEPTHGAHEPLAFRNRLVRFLVEQMGFTAIALESGFTEAWGVDSFVGGGQGDAQDIVRKGLTSGFGRFAENRELVQWMRDYNVAARAAGRRAIHFYGIDLTAGGRVSGPRRALDSALAFLARADADDASKFRTSMGDILPRSDDDQFGTLSPQAMAVLQSSVAAVAKAVAVNRSGLIARGSLHEYHWAVHNLEVARQLTRLFRVTPPASTSGPMMRDNGPQIAARDYAMAQNVRWAMDQEGPAGRIMVFAHNNHIMDWKEEGGIWANIREKPIMMGAQLRSVYGKDLLIIATASATTSGGLPAPEALGESIDSTLMGVGLPTMILDLRAARQEKAVFGWLSGQRALHANISTHVLITPSTAVDALFFVNRLTPAHIMAF